MSVLKTLRSLTRSAATTKEKDVHVSGSLRVLPERKEILFFLKPATAGKYWTNYAQELSAIMKGSKLQQISLSGGNLRLIFNAPGAAHFSVEDED